MNHVRSFSIHRPMCTHEIIGTHYSPYSSSWDDALVEGLSQNQDFFTLLLNNDEIKKEVLRLLYIQGQDCYTVRSEDQCDDANRNF